MTFEDRVSAYPGRYIMTDENGGVSYVILERADEPVRPGTPLNAETFNAMIANMHPGMQSEEHPGCFYRMIDDEVEWINPPMVLNEEYRTTERYNGHPVYKKTVEFTSMPTESDKRTEFGKDVYVSMHDVNIPGSCTVVDLYGSVTETFTQLTYPNGVLEGMVNKACFRVDGNEHQLMPEVFPNKFIEFVTSEVIAGDYLARCTVKYIKA